MREEGGREREDVGGRREEREKGKVKRGLFWVEPGGVPTYPREK